MDIRKKYNLQETLPTYIVYGVYWADRVWREVIQFAKGRMITMPKVVIGNAASNFSVLMAEGVPANFILSNIEPGIVLLNNYKEIDEKILQTQNEILIANSARRDSSALRSRLASLNKQKENHPLYPLIRDGLFQAIVDEINPEAWKPTGKLARLTAKGKEKVLSKLGKLAPSEGVQTFAENVMMVPGSQTFTLAMAANQYGDFLGRYILYTWKMKTMQPAIKAGTFTREQVHQDAVNAALDDFIFYEEAQSKYLQAGQDYGFLWFTKFTFRFQRIIFKLLKEKPANAAWAYVFSLLMMPDMNMFNEFLTFEKFGNKFSINPINRVSSMWGIPIANWGGFGGGVG
jgi:hypothetical protein